MLYVGWALEVCHSIIWPLWWWLTVGLYPTNMDYVKGLWIDEDMLIHPRWVEGTVAGTQIVYGRGSVWQVHHSVIKGHIITYNTTCMTIAGMNAVLWDYPAVSFSSSGFSPCFPHPCKSLLICSGFRCCVREFVLTYLVRTSIRQPIIGWGHSLI